MNKIESKNVSFATYDPKNPIEMAMSMWDNFIVHEGKSPWFLRDVIGRLESYGCLTDFGKKLLQTINFIDNHVATNKGLPKHRFIDYIEYYYWRLEHNLDVKQEEINIKKMMVNNPEFVLGKKGELK